LNERRSCVEKLFELIHTNIWGLVKIPSFGTTRYFVFFTNDYSRISFIYTLKSKGKCFSKFQNFKALAEKQIGEKIKILRSDNGGEFTSQEFQAF
jgi:transposase InsO family protein